MTNEELQKMLDEIANKKFAKFSDKQLEFYEILSQRKLSKETRNRQCLADLFKPQKQVYNY